MNRLHNFLMGTLFFNPVFTLLIKWLCSAIIIGIMFCSSVALTAENESGLPSGGRVCPLIIRY